MNKQTFLSAAQERVAASYGESIRTIPETAKAVAASYKTLPAYKKGLVTGAIGGAVAVTTGPAFLMGSVSAIALQCLGLAGFALGQIASQNKEHRHILALVSLSTGAMTAQSLASGDVSGAAMLGHAAAFTALCSTIPEKGYEKLRTAMTWSMGIAGASLSAIFSGAASGRIIESLSGPINEVISNIPTATVLVNSYAFSRPDIQTARARLIYLFCNVAHAAYFATRDQPSAGIILTEAFFLANNAIAAYRFDLPKTDLDAHPLSIRQRFGIFFRHTIWGGEDRSAHGLTPNDLLEKSKANQQVPEGPGPV